MHFCSGLSRAASFSTYVRATTSSIENRNLIGQFRLDHRTKTMVPKNDRLLVSLKVPTQGTAQYYCQMRLCCFTSSRTLGLLTMPENPVFPNEHRSLVVTYQAVLSAPQSPLDSENNLLAHAHLLYLKHTLKRK